MRLDEPLPRSPLAGLKLALLIGGGLVTVAGTLALVLASPANQPGSQVLGPVLISSLIQLSLMAAALYVDWPAAKLAGSAMALGLVVIDLLLNLPGWAKLSGLAQLVHVANAIVLVLLALLLLAEWRHENSPAD